VPEEPSPPKPPDPQHLGPWSGVGGNPPPAALRQRSARSRARMDLRRRTWRIAPPWRTNCDQRKGHRETPASSRSTRESHRRQPSGSGTATPTIVRRLSHDKKHTDADQRHTAPEAEPHLGAGCCAIHPGRCRTREQSNASMHAWATTPRLERRSRQLIIETDPPVPCAIIAGADREAPSNKFDGASPGRHPLRKGRSNRWALSSLSSGRRFCATARARMVFRSEVSKPPWPGRRYRLSQ
jgi:hypothetical protein